MPGPGQLVVPVAMVVGALAGAAWALLPALGQTRLRLPILITSLLLNYVARAITGYLVRVPAAGRQRDPHLDRAGPRHRPHAQDSTVRRGQLLPAAGADPGDRHLGGLRAHGVRLRDPDGRPQRTLRPLRGNQRGTPDRLRDGVGRGHRRPDRHPHDPGRRLSLHRRGAGAERVGLDGSPGRTPGQQPSPADPGGRPALLGPPDRRPGHAAQRRRLVATRPGGSKPW